MVTTAIARLKLNINWGVVADFTQEAVPYGQQKASYEPQLTRKIASRDTQQLNVARTFSIFIDDMIMI